MPDELQLKPKTEITRLLLNAVIMVSIFKNPELMEEICGPFTLPIAEKEHLLLYILLVEVLRVGYKGVVRVAGKVLRVSWLPGYFSGLLIVKYLLVLIVKIFLIFEEQHRKRFYLHSFLL
jgi:hypothetical protein